MLYTINVSPGVVHAAGPEPVVVRAGHRCHMASSVEISGPSIILYDPHRGGPEAVRVWIETAAAVRIVNRFGEAVELPPLSEP